MSIEINNIGPSRPDNSRSQGAKSAPSPESQKGTDKAPSSGSSSADNVSLSSEAKNLARIESEIKALPEVDQARVDEIKARIEQGQYQIDNDNLAQKMLDLE